VGGDLKKVLVDWKAKEGDIVCVPKQGEGRKFKDEQDILKQRTVAKETFAASCTRRDKIENKRSDDGE